MLSEVVGREEGEDMRLEALDIGVVEQLDGRILDGAVHAFGLGVGPWMVRLGEPVLDAVLDTDPVENVRAKEPAAGAVAVLRQIGEGHSVVGRHRVNLVREGPATTFRRKAAPSILPARSWNST